MKKIFLLMIAALAACGGEKARPAATTAPQHPPRPVSTALVERSGAGEVTIPAVVAARQSATLAARLSAAVRELPRREGETVAAGEVVARLDDTALRAQVAAAEAGRQVAEIDLARMQGLAQRGAATPREVEEATARAAAARAQGSAARDGLAYAVLRSPFAGVIAARKVEVGDVVSPGQPLVIVEGRGGLELRASVTAEEGALTVPAEAVFPRGGLTGVFVADGDTARLRWIAVGAPAGDRVEVRAGLAAGERVVIAPGPLADGDPIAPSNGKEGPSSPAGDRKEEQ